MKIEPVYPTPEHQNSADVISRRTYPIVYNKWIHEQIAEILGLPELYEQIAHLLEIQKFESAEIADKAREVERLLDQYLPLPDSP